MAHKVDLEDTAESVGGEKERYLASIAVSLRRIANVLEWGQGVARTLAGQDGPKLVVEYAHKVQDQMSDDETAERAAALRSGPVT